jgi:hypothetical protein
MLAGDHFRTASPRLENGFVRRRAVPGARAVDGIDRHMTARKPNLTSGLPRVVQGLGGTSSVWQALLEPLLMEGNMRPFLITALFVIVPMIGPANAADGCGPGCHSTAGGACVVDGWGTGAPVWNECPAGARARPPCGYGYAWRQSMRACFPRVGPAG